MRIVPPVERLRQIARWSQPSRRLSGSAFGHGFRDALMGVQRRESYKTVGTREDYEAGYDFGTELVEASA